MNRFVVFGEATKNWKTHLQRLEEVCTCSPDKDAQQDSTL